jgi:hypothetical protein
LAHENSREGGNPSYLCLKTKWMSDGNLGHDENSGNQPLFRAVAGIMKSEPGIKTGDCYGE